ncbi:hypothetical protein [Hyunsoonleella rubra]|uniref:Uncharacterized protein n=1 Tax=Hyunsoonleella rubra TaxID=1737062 RepID=A0ABW5TER5_9FLAO
MKRIFTLTLSLLLSTLAFAQTDGITYQAVIIGPDVLELPGVDSENNYLPVADIAIKFSIIAPGSGIVEFTEIQDTTTDEFGRVNLIIGQANHDEFEKIDWNGTPKSLKVEIDFKNGDGFVDMSIEKLTYVPYVAHRDITATGTLDVDGDTFLNRELTVDGPTTLNSTLTVAGQNASELTGDLTVDGETNLNNTLNVTNQSESNLSGPLTVGNNLNRPDAAAPTVLNGSLEVYGESTFTSLVADTLTINVETNLNGDVNITSDNQVKITSTLTGDELDINSYPLLVEGGNQGIAVRVNAVGARNNNNFISFWDETPVGLQPYEPTVFNALVRDIFDAVGIGSAGVFDGFNYNPSPGANTISGVTLPDANGPMLWGRIEGETDPDEFINNADYNLEQLSVYYDVVDGLLDLIWEIADLGKTTVNVTAASTSTTFCAGVGGCFTAPVPSLIAAAASNLAVQIIKVTAATANEVFAGYMLNTFYDNKNRFRGVSYASGAGDYAEYLERMYSSETMSYGDIVGIYGGKISKKTAGAQRMMVISYKPAVLGALPQDNNAHLFEKVAFMGQVPVKVIGPVNIGDYILPSGGNNGLGIAVSPDDITAKDVKNIVGVAWESSISNLSYNLINTAVGINNNDNSPIVQKLEQQVLEQKQQLDELTDVLANALKRLDALENGDTYYDAYKPEVHEDSKNNMDHYGRKYEIKDEIIYYEITDDEIEQGLRMAENTFKELGATKAENFILKKIKEDPNFKEQFKVQFRKAFEKQIHYHKEINTENREKH